MGNPQKFGERPKIPQREPFSTRLPKPSFNPKPKMGLSLGKEDFWAITP